MELTREVEAYYDGVDSARTTREHGFSALYTHKVGGARSSADTMRFREAFYSLRRDKGDAEDRKNFVQGWFDYNNG